MGVRFLHLADLHLGSRHEYLGERAASRQQEVLDTFRDAVSRALDPERRIDGVLISGNLFDRHRPDPATWGFARGLLGRLVASGKPVVLIPGCRDSYGYKDSVYRTERLPGVDVITAPRPGEPLRKEVAGQPVFFYGLAAQPGISAPEFPGFVRIEEEGLHIGLLNASLVGHEEYDIRPRFQTVEPAVLSRSRLDYVALGGYHGHTVLELDGTRAAYAGTIEGRRIAPGDLGRKSLLVADVEAGGVTLQQEAVSRRIVEDLALDLAAEDIRDPEGLVSALLARASEEMIARVTLTGTLEFLCDLEEVADRVRSRFHHLELVDRTDLLGSGLLRRIEGESTIRGIYVRRMMQRIEDLTERAATAAPDASVHRELRVARLALKLGLEQFIEEEPVTEYLYAPPEATAAPTPVAAVPAAPPVPTPHGVAVAAGRPGPNGDRLPEEVVVPVSPQRARALLRAERVARHDQTTSDAGEESA